MRLERWFTRGNGQPIEARATSAAMRRDVRKRLWIEVGLAAASPREEAVEE
jgi:hypothetical protein